MTLSRTVLSSLLIFGMFGPVVVQAAPYVQTDLVSDIPGLAAFTDPSLINPWGVSHTATSPFWISDQATNLYQISLIRTRAPIGAARWT
jgi:hypothetical protein